MKHRSLEDLIKPVSTKGFCRFLETYKVKFEESLDVIYQIPHDIPSSKRRKENLRHKAIYLIDKTNELLENLEDKNTVKSQLRELKAGAKSIKKDFKEYKAHLKEKAFLIDELSDKINAYQKSLDVEDLDNFKNLAFELSNGGNYLLRTIGVGYVISSFFMPPLQSAYPYLLKYMFLGVGISALALPHALIPGMKAYIRKKKQKDNQKYSK